MCSKLIAVTPSDLNGSKFAVKWLLKIPPHLKCIATLPCEIYVQEIALLMNCVNKLPHSDCDARFIQWKIILKKYSSNDVNII